MNNVKSFFSEIIKWILKIVFFVPLVLYSLFMLTSAILKSRKVRQKIHENFGDESGGEAAGGVDLDHASSERQQDHLEVEAEGLKFYNETIMHGYDIEFIENKEVCPRCKSVLQKGYCANVVCGTTKGTEVLRTSSCLFCIACPTAIVSEGLMQLAVEWKSDVKFQGVAGFERENGELAGLFETWNGEEIQYIVDAEQGAITRLIGASRPVGRKSKKGQKRKITKQSRRKNRRKK